MLLGDKNVLLYFILKATCDFCTVVRRNNVVLCACVETLMMPQGMQTAFSQCEEEVGRAKTKITS